MFLVVIVLNTVSLRLSAIHYNFNPEVMFEINLALFLLKPGFSSLAYSKGWAVAN